MQPEPGQCDNGRATQYLSLLAQGWLQGVAENGTYRRLGGSQDLSARVRLVATSSRDLGDLVAQGGFRDDLHYALGVLRVEVPPLRARLEDIPDLVAHFAAGLASGREESPPFSDDALALLASHEWPGNVRQLRHVVEGAVVTSTSGTVAAEAISLASGVQPALI